jgi:hypothetical protein
MSAGYNSKQEVDNVAGQPEEPHRARDIMLLMDRENCNSDVEIIVQQLDRYRYKDTVRRRGEREMLHPVEDVVEKKEQDLGDRSEEQKEEQDLGDRPEGEKKEQDRKDKPERREQDPER